MKAPVLLKKYGNRRLYDTRRSGYVTLVEVEEMLQAGDDVQIVDAKSGEDLTKNVLVQIILEREETREALPTSFLKQVVRLGNSPLREPFSRQLGGFLQGFLDAQRGVVAAQRELSEQMSKLSPYSFAGLNPFAAFAPPPPRIEPPPAPPREDLELRRLRDELSETQALVRQLIVKSQEGEPVREAAPKARAPRRKTPPARAPKKRGAR